MALIGLYIASFKRFLWSAPPVPVFIGISILALVLSVQILIVVRGETLDTQRSTHTALSDARK